MVFVEGGLSRARFALKAQEEKMNKTGNGASYRAAKAVAYALTLLWAAQVLATPDLKAIMANPDWIGPPVEAAW